MINSIAKKYAPVRHHRLSLGVPALPSPAAGREDHPAVVRRIGRRVDRVHAVLPGAAAPRLLLRARRDTLADVAAAEDRPLAAARRGARRDAALGERGVEAARGRGPDAAHPGTARRDDRPSLSGPLDDGAAGAGVVRARAARRLALSPVRAVEPGIHARAGELSGAGRAVRADARADRGLVGRLRGVRAAVRRA